MTRALLLFCLSLALAAPGRAAAASPPEQLQTLLREFQIAQQEFTRLHRAARTDEERLGAQEKNPLNPFIARFLAVAKQHPQDAAAFDALVWIAANGESGAAFQEAFGILANQHVENPRLVQVVEAMADFSSDGEKQLRQIIAKSPHRDVQGLARYFLAHRLKAQSPADALELLNEVVEKYAEVNYRRGSLATAAKAEVHELDKLAIGKVAPEIAGEDLEGKAFKLSDYRGKVVLVNFWGDW